MYKTLLPVLAALCLCQPAQAVSLGTSTLNGNAINAKPLLTGIKLEDKHLQACVNEHIFDRHITKPEELTELNCAQRSIRSLQGLQLFPQLIALHIKHNPVASYKPLLAISNLEQLEVSDSPTDCASLTTLRSRGVKVKGGCIGMPAN